jgi:hypothetical protein
MKKFLLTTSLIASMFVASYAQAKECCDDSNPVRLYLGGSLLTLAGTVDEDQDEDTRSGFTDNQSEVFVEARGNSHGLNYGAFVEFHNDTGALNNNLRERFIYLEDESTWGLLEVGQVEGAGRRLSVHAPTNFGFGGINGVYAEYINLYDGTIGTRPDDFVNNGANNTNGLDDLFWGFNSQAQGKVSYYTPAFEGLQLGVSYAPGGGEKFRGRIDNTANFEDIVEIGANYTGDFDGVGVALNLGYNFGNSSRNNTEDLQALQAGFQVSFDGFTVGGGYVNQFDSGLSDASGADDDDTEGFNYGVSYEIGDVVIGFNGLSAEGAGDDASNSDNNEYDVYTAGLTYNFVPGLAFSTEVFSFDYEDEETVAARDASNDGTGLIVGLKAEF